MVDFSKTNNEVILRKFTNSKGEKYILTGGRRTEYTTSITHKDYTIRNLYKERHITKGLDTFEQIESKEYDHLSMERNIKWITKDNTTDVKMNIYHRPRLLDKLSITGKNITIQLDVLKEDLRISKFNINEQLAKNLTTKIKRALKLIQKNF